ncbi:hypothetical protein [Halobacillus litoralis]|uniref:hypothetical protein n=1 Tax=Halobacillus TaxID=45667 RepID=UPI0013E89900|nr:hypothetical protein [Halobacillus litoralis]
MLTSLYLMSLTVLLTFLVLYAIDNIVSRFKKINNHTIQPEQVPAEVEFSHHTFK